MPPAPTCLGLSGLPAHSRLSVDFLLAVIDSWDGDHEIYGRDRLRVTIDGNEATGFDYSFSNFSGNSQTYPGAPFVRERLGFDFNDEDLESGYHIRLIVPHDEESASVEIVAAGDGWEGGLNESWAIDNLRISVSIAAENLVRNGSFDGGMQRWATEYQQSDTLGDQGTYRTAFTGDIINHPVSAIRVPLQHDGSPGRMVYFNGSTQPGRLALGQNVLVEQHSRYLFSMWVRKWSPVRSQLVVEINGSPILTQDTGVNPSDVWFQLSATWESGTTGAARLRIFDTSLISVGNDFIIDDVELTKRFGFIRGDSNTDGNLDISDAVAIFRALYTPLELDCEDAADSDDNGTIEMADGIRLLQCLFRAGICPPPPSEDCGEDPTDDELTCLHDDTCGQ